MSARATRRAALSLAGLLVATSAWAVTPPAVWAPGEAALQARIVAPCCWNQTLDMHESELASSLRTEIHERLLAGETREGIEDDLAARFGERVRAVPKGDDRRAYVGSIMVALIGLGGALALGFLRRLRRRSDRVIPPEIAPNGPRDAYDDRLDAELWALGSRDDEA